MMTLTGLKHLIFYHALRFLSILHRLMKYYILLINFYNIYHTALSLSKTLKIPYNYFVSS
jgi:hypothetical protein